MTDNLPAARPTCPVALYDADAAHVLEWALSGATRPVITGPLELINYPEKDARAVLGIRLQTLAASLGQKDNEAVAKAVTAALLCFPALMKEGDAKHKRQVVAKYVTELQGVPAWAVIHACDAIREGRAGLSATYPPSTIEVRAVAMGYTESIRHELERIDSVLRAVQAPPQLEVSERKAIGVKLQGLGDELRGSLKERDAADDAMRQSYAQKFSGVAERFIRREYGSAAVVECAPGIPISKSLTAKMREPRTGGGW